jgi:hypothetical protein
MSNRNVNFLRSWRVVLCSLLFPKRRKNRILSSERKKANWLLLEQKTTKDHGFKSWFGYKRH